MTGGYPTRDTPLSALVHLEIALSVVVSSVLNDGTLRNRPVAVTFNSSTLIPIFLHCVWDEIALLVGPRSADCRRCLGSGLCRDSCG